MATGSRKSVPVLRWVKIPVYDEHKEEVVKSKRNNILNWLQKPESVFSLFAFFLALSAFFSINLIPGEIEIYPPEQVAVSFQQNYSRLVIPIVLYNSASPERWWGTPWKTIKDMNVSVTINTENRSKENINFNWEGTKFIMGEYEFEKNYPERIKNGSNFNDHFLYEMRKMPFSIEGKQTVSKLFYFTSRKNISENNITIDILLKVITTDNITYSFRNQYNVSKQDFESMRQRESYRWVSETNSDF